MFRNRFLEFKASQQQQALPLIYSSERLNSESLREQAPGPPTSCAGYYGRPGHVGEFGGYTTADPQSRARFTAAFRHALDGQKLGWAMWDWSAAFRYWDKKNNQPMPGLHEALFVNSTR